MTLEQSRIITDCQRTAPVDITDMATRLGVTVYDDGDLPASVSGMIARDTSGESKSGYVITVNGNEPYLRRRFTIAHELAHFLKHKDKIGDGITDDPMYRSELNSQYEFEANNVAADLLMPKQLVLPRLRQSYDIGWLAEEFQVSVAAMKVRVRYLYRFDYAPA